MEDIMNGKMAKRIRKFVYGSTFSPRHRKYSTGRGGMRVADDRRQRYQAIKKGVSRGEKGWI